MAATAALILGFFGLLAAVGVAGYVAMLYNRLVRLQRNVDQAWSNVDVLLKQRHEELPKLIDVASEYIDHERDLLQRVTDARSRATQAQSPGARADREAELESGVAELFAVAEDYPQLQSSEQFLTLQERIADIETQIADRREFYNGSVTTYNTRINQFPYLVFAALFGFSERELFEATDAETEDVDLAEQLA